MNAVTPNMQNPAGNSWARSFTPSQSSPIATPPPMAAVKPLVPIQPAPIQPVQTEHAPKQSKKPDLSFQSLNKYLRLTYLALLLLVVGVGGWAAMSNIKAAVISQGTIVVDGKPKTVQHIDGGIIRKINVKDGQLVQKGEVIFELDAAIINANQTAAASAFYENEAYIARLLAQQNGSTNIVWPTIVQRNKYIPSVRLAMSGQQNLLYARTNAVTGQIRQLNLRIQQFRDQVKGLNSRIKYGNSELSIVQQDLQRMQTLLGRNLVEKSRVTKLEREAIRLKNENANLRSERNGIFHSVNDLKMEIDQIHRKNDEVILTELRLAQTQAAGFAELLKTTSSKKKLVQIIAPTAGTIHNMQVTTIGGVIVPGQELLQIIPANARLIVEARIQPKDIDQVSIGQSATVRFSGLNQKQSPELLGNVNFVSPNTLTDPNTGNTYYAAKIQFSQSELAKIKNVQILPGMQADTFIQTQDRSVLSYLLKPVKDAFAHTMRES